MLKVIDRKVGIKDVVAKQLPEFVRENYPTFVAFVEAYYEFLQNNAVRLDQVRDIDLTLDNFIQYFKKELAHNYPGNLKNERFLLSHIRDEYLAKGSEASYRLLFRLLYGKEIYMDFPGKSMLRVSDGRWKQDISVFARVDAGDPTQVIGKTIDVQTSRRIFRTEVNPSTQKLTKVTANVESAVLVDPEKNIWEIFLDRNFYGTISFGDVLKFGSSFQALVLPTTSKLKIQNGGQGFRPGQVFQISSGNGTPIWFKVTSVDDNGGLLTIDVIKFALGYDTDFSITILPSSAVTTSRKIKKQVSSITYSKVLGTVGRIELLGGGSGYTATPTVVIGGNGTGATARAVMSGGIVREIIMENLGEGYTTAFANIVPAAGDTTGSGAAAEAVIGDSYSYNTVDSSNGFSELGYINYGDYWSSEYSDGAYVGTVARQFYLDAKDTIGDNPALINVFLDAVAKYPGYYKSNEGFLDDANFIQDSKYYQAFSYVIRIDEQLQSYAAVVRSMLHPSGMALFGEYSINNKFDLSVALEVMIKTLGVGVFDELVVNDESRVYTMAKALSSTTEPVTDLLDYIVFQKALAEEFSFAETLNYIFSKQLLTPFTTVEVWTHETSKDVTDSFTNSDADLTLQTTKDLLDLPVATDSFAATTDKYVIDTTVGTFTKSGYIVKNPYEEGGYFLEIYANGRESTF